MKTSLRSSGLLLLLVMTVSLFSQAKEESAVICGRILFEEDSIYPLKPYSIMVRKSWPITFRQFEQAEVDSTDDSFIIRMDLDQLTYGNIVVSFFQNADSTAISQNKLWVLPEKLDDFRKSEYTARIIFAGVRFVIEPGDSLFIEIDYNRVDQHGRAFVNFSGRGGANNNLKRSRDHFRWRSQNFRLPLEEGLSNEDLLMKNELKNLHEAKDSLSQPYFNLLKTDILFNNLKMKHALIRASLYGSSITSEEKRAKAREYYTYLDTLTLKPEYLNSPEFRGFLGLYLEYINRIVTGRDIPYNISENRSYMAKAIFEENLLKTFLYERLKLQMEELHFYTYGTFSYKEFVNQFPDTPESYRLAQIHHRRYPVSNGQPAPDLILIDSVGHTTCLSDLRGKVVIISQYYSGLNIDEDKQKHIGALRKKFAGEEMVMVALRPQYRGHRDYFCSSIDYYVKDDIDNQNLDLYHFWSQRPYTFIIKKNGIIEDRVYNLRISDETISRLKSERYTAFTRLNDFAQDHAGGITIILSFIISLTLVFILITKLKQRRQDLIKKQLNSELKAIRSQLNPHFLFNALNSIQNFINKSDTKTANMHLSRFSLLMRKVIELSEKESVTLKEELDFNRTFIELEQLRYGFKFMIDIDDTIDLYNTEIPGMIIQPFIENAIVHCMADLGAKGELSISVKENDKNKIYIEITDNGKGFSTDSKKGFGLKSSRERIDLLNSQNRDKIELQIQSSTDTLTKQGTTIKLIIPKKY